MDRVVHEDVVGEAQRSSATSLNEIDVPECLRAALKQHFASEIKLTPPQVWAVVHGIITETAHYLVSAPTNSGKTLIAYLRIFAQAIVDKTRSVYVVPLKALAEEKAEEMRALAEQITASGGPAIGILVSTGDYQLSDDFLGSPPPESGEILICTPERLEVILRDPKYDGWASSIKTYVIDEFHLLGERTRGATVESLVTRLITQYVESSLVALSATIGGLDDLSSWLSHAGASVHVLDSSYRFPPLRRVVLETENKHDFISREAKRVLATQGESLLIFVYRKIDAEKLNKTLSEDLAGKQLVGHFHSGLSLEKRREVATSFQQGQCRVLITTTSLKMGVNTPSSVVIVRDTLFHGSGRLKLADILQMIGRAGRAERPGTGYVLCDASEDAEEYAQALQAGYVEELQPQLFPDNAYSRYRTKRSPVGNDVLSAAVLTEFARSDVSTIQKVASFLQHSYSGWRRGMQSPDLRDSIGSLVRSKLIYKIENSENSYGATRLGRTTARSGLSPRSGAMIGQFLRALIRLAQKESEQSVRSKNYLRQLRDLDLLFLSVASHEGRPYLVRKPTKSERAATEEYIERLPIDEKPLVNLWRSTTSNEYPTRRLLSSLDFGQQQDTAASALFLRLMRTAILLHRHAKGEPLADLAVEFGTHPGSLESGLKYTTTWVLNCIAQICSPDKCYRLSFLAMRAYALLEDLSLGAPVGKLVSIKGIGRRSVQKLVAAGCANLDDVCRMDTDDLRGLGLNTNQATRILRFARRASR